MDRLYTLQDDVQGFGRLDETVIFYYVGMLQRMSVMMGSIFISVTYIEVLE